jgi:hypothetical protein
MESALPSFNHRSVRKELSRFLCSLVCRGAQASTSIAIILSLAFAFVPQVFSTENISSGGQPLHHLEENFGAGVPVRAHESVGEYTGQKPSAPREVVFISDDIAGFAKIAAAAAPSREVVIVDHHRDGLAQMVEALAGRTGLGAIHLVTHGAPSAKGRGAEVGGARGQRAWGQGQRRTATRGASLCRRRGATSGASFL